MTRSLAWLAEGRSIVTAAVLLAAGGCAPAEDGNVAAERAPILGGIDVPECGWPSTVLVQGGGGWCTGVLIHPEVVATAAHCSKPDELVLGETRSGRSVAIDGCARHPDYTGESFANWDYMVCTVAEPLDEVPLVPILMGCDSEVLDDAGHEATVLGFGESDSGRPARVKRSFIGEMSSIRYSFEGSYAVDSVADGDGAAAGDSGGPTFIQLSDGTWRVAGTHNAGNLGGVTDRRLALAAPWIEEHTGFDVTPCHDADGTWNPTERCGDFPLDPATGAGSWPSCEPGPTSGTMSETCGTAFGTSPDAGGPDASRPDAGAADAGGDGGGSDASAGYDARSGDDGGRPGDASGEGADAGGAPAGGNGGCATVPAEPAHWLWALMLVVVARRRARAR